MIIEIGLRVWVTRGIHSLTVLRFVFWSDRWKVTLSIFPEGWIVMTSSLEEILSKFNEFGRGVGTSPLGMRSRTPCIGSEREQGKKSVVDSLRRDTGLPQPL